MSRRGRAGYHLVARSPGVSEAEASALERWCPSHGGLLVDDENAVSVNFFRLNGGRFVISRTCLGRPEFSGRGGRQVYTRALLVGPEILNRAGFRPFLIYRDALALGHLHFRPDPPMALPRVELSSYFEVQGLDVGSTWNRDQNLPVFDSIINQLNAGQSVVVPFAGDRTALAESILSRIDPTATPSLSFATSLRPSNVRPFQFHVVPPGTEGS